MLEIGKSQLFIYQQLKLCLLWLVEHQWFGHCYRKRNVHLGVTNALEAETASLWIQTRKSCSR